MQNVKEKKKYTQAKGLKFRSEHSNSLSPEILVTSKLIVNPLLSPPLK